MTASRAGQPPAPGAGCVALVGAGPGDAGLLTRRGAQLLAAADVVLVDRLVSAEVVALARADAEVIDVGKVPQRTPAQAQRGIEDLLLARARAGLRVVRLKGGDPFVFGRGAEELAACRAAGVPCEVVPGVSSAFAVPAYAGIPVTARGLTQQVSVVSGHLDPDDPDSLLGWAQLAQGVGTLVILMGLARLEAIVTALVTHGRDPLTPAACIAAGTLPGQRTVVAELVALPERVRTAGLAAPVVTVVGEVVALRDELRWWAGEGSC